MPRPPKQTDSSDYVGHRCQVCGELVNVAAGSKSTTKGGSYWRRHPGGHIEAWHLNCLMGVNREQTL